MRIATGQLIQETCVNAPRATTREEFNVDDGEDVLPTFEGTKCEMGGFIDVADEAGDVTLVPIFSARSSPGAPVADPAFESFVDAFVEGLRGESVDGVMVAVHGAMLTPTREDPEGELLAAIAEVVGDVPVVVTTDPHAHVTPRMVDLATGIVCYRTNPHVDIYETGRRGMELLVETVRGEVEPTMAMSKVPTMMTGAEALYERVAEIERDEPAVLRASYHNVQSFFDVVDMGHGGLIVTDGDRELANRLAEDVAREVWERRADGTPVRPDGRPSVPEILQRIVDEPRDAPYVLMDDGDHMCAGAPGDSPVFLRELLASEETADLAAAIQIVAPDAVERLSEGDSGPVSIGGTLTPGFSPLVVDCVVDGVYEEPLVTENRLSAGTEDFFGKRVAVSVADSNVSLVLTERSGRANDPNFFAAHGIDPEDQDLVVIQCFHNVADYEPIASEIVRVDSPGVTAAPYDFLRKSRPIYPLDDPDPTFRTFDGYWALRN